MVSLVGGVLFLWQNETKELEEQEQIGSALADEYLLSISESNLTLSEEETPILLEDEFEYEDNEIFGSYSEANAVGSLDCVLEIPAIELRQSVFTGTPSQIRRNLSKWLAVTGRSDYILGSTHYCIYMHNPTNKSIRISYAQETLVPGDYIVITKDNTVFFYEMTRMFPEWRQTCTKTYTDNMAISSDWVYIFTCARGEWQGRNLVIEGRLYNTYALSDWQENSLQYIAEYEGQYEEKTVDDMLLMMDITEENGDIQVTVRRPDGTHALHCAVGLFNNEGYVVGEEYPYTGSPLKLNLAEGQYIIGVSSNNTQYGTPMPYQINLTKQKADISTIDQVETNNEENGKTMMTVAISLLGVFSILYILVAINTIKDIVKQHTEQRD